MKDSTFELWGAVAGMGLAISVAVPVLVGQLGGHDLVFGPWWLWWLCYLAYLAALVLVEAVEHRRWRITPQHVLVVLGLLGAAAVLLMRTGGWTVILLVITAATAAYYVSPRATLAVIAAHGAVLVAWTQLTGAGAVETAMVVLIYTVIQAASVFLVMSHTRETRAREALAEAHAELRAATALLAESSRNRERLRIARELHDLVGHQLTALALELEVAAHRSSPPASEHVARARRIAKDLLTDVRTAVGELRSRAPELRPALEAMTADLPRPRVHLAVDEGLELDGERATALVRCVQEIVTNTVRHADADNLWIRITCRPDGQVVLAAHDDGRGAASLERGNGLTGLEERVRQLGGDVSFEPERGFRVVAEVPP